MAFHGLVSLRHPFRKTPQRPSPRTRMLISPLADRVTGRASRILISLYYVAGVWK